MHRPYLNDDLELNAALPRIKNLPDPHKARPNKKIINSIKHTTDYPADPEDSLENLELTYHPSRHEREWIIKSLSELYDQKWFTDILRLVKGGKEASVYLCQTQHNDLSSLLAAKIYRPRRFRSLKNDHLYQEGRSLLDASGNIITDDGMLHAIRKKTAFGLGLSHASWIEHEFKTLQTLYQAGADVPQPLACVNNAILMGYVGDLDQAAPALMDVTLPLAEARVLFEQVIHNIDRMLAHDRIHADLSAYNILYWEGKITLIDFPQAIHPNENRSAFSIFKRDVQRVCEYFYRQGVQSDPRQLANELWTRHQQRTDLLIDPALLDEQSEQDRAYWQSLSEQ
jgi:RIO kinase 1